jgi:hypothetical protein
MVFDETEKEDPYNAALPWKKPDSIVVPSLPNGTWQISSSAYEYSRKSTCASMESVKLSSSMCMLYLCRKRRR